MYMPQKPEIIAQRLVASSRLFRVEEMKLRFSNGVERTYERLLGGKCPAVIVIPVLDNDTVILIREYGGGVDRYELALPKGRVEPEEDILEAANRELKEEIGYGARELELFKLMTQSPNYMQHRTQVVIARGLYPESAEGDEPERLDVVEVKLSELETWIMREDLTEARSIAALLMYKNFCCAGAS